MGTSTKVTLGISHMATQDGHINGYNLLTQKIICDCHRVTLIARCLHCQGDSYANSLVDSNMDKLSRLNRKEKQTKK